MQPSVKRTTFLDELVELLSSMRFAISLLTVLAIASVIGTVVQQDLPPNAYLNQFGSFWDPVFSWLGLYTVYNSAWFIAILAFLVLSTTLCIIRLFTPMMREIRSFRENARETSLRHFSHCASLEPSLPPEERNDAVSTYLTNAGFRFRIARREDDNTLIAAKQGSLSRVGYFLAHGAIVLICLGGLLDSNVPLSLQLHFQGKTPTKKERISEIPHSAWLESSSWSFRGNTIIPEGKTTHFAVLNTNDGILLQSLPFKIELKRFHIDHYETGMPKYFASDVVITDNHTGEVFERTIEVNKPFRHRGITLYQSGHDDGGSALHLAARPLVPKTYLPNPLNIEVGAKLPFTDEGHAIEITGFTLLNIENLSVHDNEDSRARTAFFGSATQKDGKNLLDRGPTFSYILRDPAGQVIREITGYMQPFRINGRKYLVSRASASPREPPSWLGIPFDEDDSVDTWFAIHQFFFDSKHEHRDTLIERFASHASSSDEKTVRTFLATRILTYFPQGGLKPVIDELKPVLDQLPDSNDDNAEKAEMMLLEALQGLTWDAWMLVREITGKSVLEPNETHSLFANDALHAIANSLHYGAPFHLQLTSYEQRRATILQATRSPGKPLVYLGSLLLTLGIFAMLYIRERRLFVLFKKDEALLAMSSGRKTIDLDETFARHRDNLAAVLGASAPLN